MRDYSTVQVQGYRTPHRSERGPQMVTDVCNRDDTTMEGTISKIAKIRERPVIPRPGKTHQVHVAHYDRMDPCKTEMGVL